MTTLKIPLGGNEAAYAKPSQAPCQSHGWPTERLATFLLEAFRRTHGRGGFIVCLECLDRARRGGK